jgi:preprotein translocase subunit SecG
MYGFLLAILIIDSLVLMAAILMQAAKGGGLAASFGGVSTAADAFIGSRQAGDVLSKLTWWTGGIFLSIAFVLQLMTARGQSPGSILDQPLTESAPTTTAPPATGTPVIPLAPASKDTSQAPQKKNP